jgi:photosystem II stability/assembly factor-like uncharacterized protein
MRPFRLTVWLPGLWSNRYNDDVRGLAAFVLLGCSGILAAQQASTFAYTCTAEDVDDFGLICSEEEPCPVFLELNELEAVGSTLFLTGNLHTQTTTMWGLLLMSEDGGKTWTEPAQRLKTSALEHIQFVGLAKGWVSGVMLEPLPRNPFLMATTDGGKTWRRYPMFEDAHFGSVQQFWFESDKVGDLVLDASSGSTKKYELYSTQTGGDTWDVKEITKVQPRLTKARPRDTSTWRIRVDSTAKVYRVEQRVAQASGSQWQTIATFPVVAGACQ